MTYRAQQPVALSFDRPLGSTVMRANFDYKLAQAAVAAGAQLIQRCRVRHVSQTDSEVLVETEGQTFHGRYLVGADSVNSTVARALGMPRQRAAIAFEAELPVTAEALARYRDTLVFDFGGVPYGYAWILPSRTTCPLARRCSMIGGTSIFGSMSSTTLCAPVSCPWSALGLPL